MPTSREIPPEAWAHASEALVFYFSRRVGMENAEDLAQQTLMTVAQRGDYTFTREEDFLKVCYGFAGNILKAAFRHKAKRTDLPLDTSVPEPQNRGEGAVESAIFLEEVLRIGVEQLKERDWALIWQAAEAQLERRSPGHAPAEANGLRVALHRARKKLARITGWRTDKGVIGDGSGP